MHPLIKAHETRVQLHDVPAEVVEDVVKNEGQSKHLRANAIDKSRPHVLAAPLCAVRIEYSVAGGMWCVTRLFGMDLGGGEDIQVEIHDELAEQAPVPAADPLDVLYPPHAGANERDH